MMLTELLATLRDLNVHLYAEGDALKCKAPKNALSDNVKAQLKAQKKELIALLSLAGKHGHTPIIPVLRTQPIPLSYAQQRLWFLDQLELGNAFYNIPVAVRLSGELNDAALEQSLNEIVRRHENLRTTFITANGQAEQTIAARLFVPVAYTDLTALPEPSRQTALVDLCHREASRPFELSTGPLIRVSLLRLANEADKQECVLLVILHHIISDGWSSSLLIREFGSIYEAFSQGSASPLKDPAIQYADFVYWQRQWLVGDVLQGQTDYWRKQLEGAPKLHELPTDRVRPGIMSYRGANYRFTLPLALAEKLQTLSRSCDATLFMTLLASFKVLLFRYSHQQDLSIGTPIANRNRLEIEDLIGFFVNTLVLRSNLSGDPQFTVLLGQIRQTVLDAQSHQDLPFEQVVEALQPERNMSFNPLFQVLFVLQNTPQSALKLSGLHINSMDDENTTTKFDLTLFITERAGALECTFEYNVDLFDHSTISRLAEHYLVLLQGIVNRPQARLSELPLLTQKEQQRILIDWNDTTVNYPQGKYIPQLFEDRAAQMPNAAAVVFDDQSLRAPTSVYGSHAERGNDEFVFRDVITGPVLSYSELNARANQLAHYLRAKGVGPDVLVGLCVERSLEMIVGLMGILKAGGAYVPLDPGYPQDRLDFMITDVNAPIVLTQAALLNKLAVCSTRILCLDTQWHEVAVEPATNPAVAIMPENLAYCIYTSGSTGQPKGVGVPHQGILNRLQWMQEQYGLNEMDRVLQKTPFSFDVSVWEFFWPLMTGACLFVAGPEQHKDSIAMMNMIVDHQISTVHFVPSMLQAFVDTPGVERCTSLKRVICSGEALPADVVRRFYEKSTAQLHNLYGPTEASVDVTAWFCVPDKADDSIPIGRPIANISLYILDKQLNPVPVGALGELHIGGIGLARGYLNRPDLTAEKFIPNPFGAPGSRLYKTGDLTRYLSNGDIAYAGRIDHQVKIRGVRIELGEIESLLMQSPDVKEVVVLAREDIPGDKRLVTYVVPERINQNPDVEGFRSTISGEQVSQWQMHPDIKARLQGLLQEKLPGYMVPSHFAFLDALPLTASGKVDRKALPALDLSVQLQKQYVAPRTQTEEILTGIWAEILNVNRIGVHDNFFELGGNSLLAVTLAHTIQSVLGGNLDLIALFQAPTIEEFARLLADETAAVSSPLVTLKSAGTRAPLYCIDPGGYVFEYKTLAQAMSHDQPVYGIDSRSLLLNPTRQYASFTEAAEYYVQAILRHQPEGPYYLLGWSMGGTIALIVAQILESRGHEVAFVGLLDTRINSLAQVEANTDLLTRYARYLNPAERQAFDRIDAATREEFQAFLSTLPVDEQLEQVILWATRQGCLHRNLPVALMKLQFIVAENSLRLMNAHQWGVIKAPLYAWWASDTLKRHGQIPEDWRLYTTGSVVNEEVEGNHRDIIKNRQLHSSLAGVLKNSRASS